MNFVIDDQQKALFEEYVESTPEFESLSHFFRTAGLREMKDNDDSEPSAEIIERLDGIQQDLDVLSGQVADINTYLDMGTTDVELLADKVRKELISLPQPSPTEVSKSNKTTEELQTQFAYTIVGNENPTTIEDLAKVLNEDKQDVKDAIEDLRSKHIPIESKVLDDGDKHYFKEGERR